MSTNTPTQNYQTTTTNTQQPEMATPTQTLIRASVQGIVYLIDSVKGLAYTYNPERPVFVGHLERIPDEDKNSISKTNGCMATARIRYREDIHSAMAEVRGTHDSLKN